MFFNFDFQKQLLKLNERTYCFLFLSSSAQMLFDKKESMLANPERLCALVVLSVPKNYDNSGAVEDTIFVHSVNEGAKRK